MRVVGVKFAIEKASEVSAGIQNRSLRSTNPIFDIILVIHDISKLVVPWMAEGSSISVGDCVERDNALPRLRRVRQTTFGGTSDHHKRRLYACENIYNHLPGAGPASSREGDARNRFD